MEAIKLCRLDTPIIFIEARINLSRFVVTGCAAKTSATRSEERFSRNAETDLVCRLLLEKKKQSRGRAAREYGARRHWRNSATSQQRPVGFSYRSVIPSAGVNAGHSSRS